MPLDFVRHVESGINHLNSDDWLIPETVRGLTDVDFVTLPLQQRDKLFRCAKQFCTIAQAAPNVDDAQTASARAALTTIWEILRPYRTPESRKILNTLWECWQDKSVEYVRKWIPTFDYQLGEDSTGDPAIWIWLILNDDVDIEAPITRVELNLLRIGFDVRLREAGIDRTPYVSVWTQSDARERSVRIGA